MDQAPMVAMIDDGQRLIEAMTKAGIGVSSAFWAKVGDDERWYLYIATPLLNTVSVTEAYRRLHPIIRQLQEQRFWVDPFEIKLIHPQSSTAQAAAKLSGNHPGITRSGGSQLGGEPVDGAIIYPTAGTVLPGKG